VIDIRILTSDLRKELKAPLGLLIKGSYKQTIEKLRKIVEETKPEKIVAVGDRVTKNILRSGIILDVAIVDGKVMRKQVKLENFGAKRIFYTSNPAGTLSEEACRTIEEAIDLSGFNEVQVDGEEDLLALAAVLYAPVGSIVVYGQPKKGMVVVSVTNDVKRKIRDIMNRMKNGNSKD